MLRKKNKKIIDIIRNNKDATDLFANLGYLSVLQIASYIFPIITLPYLARVIGVDSFGRIAFASAIIVWFQTLVDWGFNYTATRDVARNRGDKVIVSNIFSNVLWAKTLLMIISFALLLVITFTVPKFKDNQDIIFITFLIIPSQIIFPDWFFQGMERMKYITFFNLISKTLFTMAVFIFIKDKSDYILYPFFIAFGTFISGIFAMYIILVKMKVKFKIPSLISIFYTLKLSANVFFNNILPNFYNSFSILLLGFWGGPISNGLLDASKKFILIAHQFMNVISRVFFPYLSRKIDKHAQFAKMYLLIAIIGSFVLFLFAPILIKFFFTSEFYDAIVALRISSISILLIAIDNIYGQNYMIVLGYEKELRNITFRVSVIGFLISFPLVYYFDFIGVVVMLTIIQFISAIAVFRKARQIKNKHSKIV